jgi:hypothetical protein
VVVVVDGEAWAPVEKAMELGAPEPEPSSGNVLAEEAKSRKKASKQRRRAQKSTIRENTISRQKRKGRSEVMR